MRRKLFFVAVMLSLLLCVATVALWVRSYWYLDTLTRMRSDGRFVQFASVHGVLTFGVRMEATIEYGDAEKSWRDAPWAWRDAPWAWRDRVKYVESEWQYAGCPAFAFLRYFGVVRWAWAGFSSSRYDNTSGNAAVDKVTVHDRYYSVPHWFVTLILLGFPTVYARSLLARYVCQRRVAGGRCRKCGYDLTGNTSGACPECGTSLAGRA